MVAGGAEAEAAKTTENMIEEAMENAREGADINEKVAENFSDIVERVQKVREVMQMTMIL